MLIDDFIHALFKLGFFKNGADTNKTIRHIKRICLDTVYEFLDFTDKLELTTGECDKNIFLDEDDLTKLLLGDMCD